MSVSPSLGQEASCTENYTTAPGTTPGGKPHVQSVLPPTAYTASSSSAREVERSVLTE